MKKHRGNYHDLLLVAALLVTLILIGSQLPAYAAASPVGSAMQIPLDAAQTYTLTYNANGGVIPPPAQKGLMTDSTIARLSIHIPFRTDHTFLGWGISPQANVAYYPADSISIVNPSTTLYAVWEYTPNLPVTYFLAYDYNGGIGGPATQLGLLANTTTIIGNSIPIRANYKFLGWAYSPTASGALYQPGDIIVIGNASVDLYALWEPAVEPQKRTLSYNANFGINAPPNQTGYTDKTYATVGSGQPSHANHTFIGWALSPYATEPQYFAGDTIFLSSGNVTLHAVWARGIHTLTGFVSPLAEDDLGLPDFLAKHEITVELRSTFRTPAVKSLCTKVVQQGSGGVGKFTFENVPLGSYVLYIYRPAYLTRAMPVTVAANSPATIALAPPGTEDKGIFNLWAGDCNNDLIIENKDYMMILELLSEGVNIYDPRYNPACDLNADGKIDDLDLLMVYAKFGLVIWDYAGAENIDIYK